MDKAQISVTQINISLNCKTSLSIGATSSCNFMGFKYKQFIYISLTFLKIVTVGFFFHLSSLFTINSLKFRSLFTIQ